CADRRWTDRTAMAARRCRRPGRGAGSRFGDLLVDRAGSRAFRCHAVVRRGGPALGGRLCASARWAHTERGMKLALVLPGGVDRTGEYRVIPVFLALIERLARDHEVHVFVLRQEAEPGEWDLVGARIHNIGDGWSRLRAVAAIRAGHRRAPFDLVHAIFSGYCSLVAVAAARLLRLPSLVHIAGGELVALPAIGYGG